MATPRRRELFISYGREPAVNQFVQRLKKDLEEGGLTVWLDTKDIPAGSDWHGAIGSGLERCKAIIPVLTSKYISSRYCVNELYTADSDRKMIFPIMFEDIDFSISEAGPGIKFVVSSVNWTMCRPGVDDYNNSISRLIQSLKEKGLGNGDASDEDDHADAPPTDVSAEPPLIGPSSIKPFKVIPDVPNPEGITTTDEGNLIVTIMEHKVLCFNSDHEKTMELGGDPGISVGQFMSPSGVAVDADGNILVASHFFVQKFSPTGKFLQQVGGMNEQSFSLHSPRGMAIGKSGRVYITEQQKHRVAILNSDLSFYKRFTDADRMLGSGHLNMPQGIAVNSRGNVYVADMMNHAMQVFDSEGEFQFRFGKMGTGPGATSSPTSIAIDSLDYVYVGTGNCCVCVFDAGGKFVRSFGEHGSEVGKFNMIRALHVDCNNILYVGESTCNRIQLFRIGESLGKEGIASSREGPGKTSAPSVPLHRMEGRGVKTGQEVVFAKSASTPCKRSGVNSPIHTLECKKEPWSVAVGRNGDIVVSTKKDVIYVFNKSYELVAEQRFKDLSHCCVVVDDSNTIIAAGPSAFAKLDMELNKLHCVLFHKHPDLKERMTFPYAMAVGKEGKLYIAGVKKAYIVDSADFTLCKIFAEKCQAFGIAVNSIGLVYLSAQKENTVRVFTADGDPIFQFGGPGRSPLPHMTLLCPMTLAIDCKDSVYVATAMKHVNVFDKDGAFLEKYQRSEAGQDDCMAASLCADDRGRLFVAEGETRKIYVYKLDN